MIPQSISHYRIIKELGAGGMGEVWLAEDTRLDRKVALKLLPAEFTQDADRVRRFMQEAKAASALNHPNIITVFDIGESEAGRFIVMELVAGRTLRSVIVEDNSVETLLTLGSQIAKALSAAHGAGITHRDIKPDNIMVRDDGYVKVLDFGLARLLPTTSGEDAATLALQTTPGMIMGTVAYMSPEQASGQSVGPPSDIFALGIVLYELVTGRHPFRADTLIGYLHAITLQTPRPPSQLRPGIPATLDGLFLRMLKKEASLRPSATEVAKALQEMERDRDSATRPHTESETILLPTAPAGVAPADEGFWVAVLPFKWRGTNPDLEALAEGLTEDVVTGLSRFSYLRVIARGSTLKYSNESRDVQAIGKELGARYVMEGSIRQAGATVRLAVQLVDASTGVHLWAETYDRAYSAEQVFALQDDLVPRIVSTCADHFGVLARSISEAVRWKDSGQLSPYEALMRGFGYHHRLSVSEHAEAREVLERAVEQAPGNADCWAMLSWVYSHEYGHGFNAQPGSLDRALVAARRAIDLAPSNHLAYQTLAVALFFRKDIAGCLSAAERALVLNPLDASNEAIFLITFTGDWARGCALIAKAMELNPHHPGWYHWVLALNEYRATKYREAVDKAVKANAPEIFWTSMLLAAAHGQLGELEAAREALRNLLAQKEDFVEWARETLGKWFEAELVEHLVEGLRKAGLDVFASLDNSAGLRADEGFWVAVLPFKYRGANDNLEALAEGLSEDILTGLARFSYLRVIARGSTLRYTSESGDMRAIGKALGARYVMEGRLRQAGSVLRIAVQLVDANTGAHLWAETYNRTFSLDEVFELQDDLVPRIVSTVADWYGVLPHSMSEAVRLKPSDQLSPYEAVLRSFGYFERIAAEEHAAVRAGLERAVEQLPGNADGWAMLSMMYGEEHRFGFNVRPDPMGRSLQAARRAVDAAHANHFAWLALAQALFFRKEYDVFRDAAERAIALNPMDGSTVEYLGHLIAFSGDWERGCDLAESARQLNPNHPGWYWAVNFLDAYRKGQYRTARTFILKGNQPGHFFMQALVAAVHGQLGEREAAEKALREVLTLKPDFSLTARDDFGKWYLPELVEQLIEGLRKAGLEVVETDRAASPQLSTELNKTDVLRLEIAKRQPAIQHTASPPQSIAVLPFANISADEENEYFCDGLAEELLLALAKIEDLKVAARTSAFSFKGKNAEAREIGRTLNVNTVLEGSVRKQSSRVRINVQLVNAADGYQLWSERYDREMQDIFDVQDEITLAVVDALKLKLFGEEKAGIFERKPNSPEALDLYLKGRFHFQQHTSEGFEKAIWYFQKAIDEDSNYALAFAGLSSVLIFRWFFGFVSADEVIPNAKNAALRALEINGNLDEAHIALAHICMFYEWNLEKAEQEYREAIRLNPKNAYARYQYGLCLAVMEKPQQAILEAEKAIDLEPLSVLANFQVAAIYFQLGKFEESSRYTQMLIEMAPEFYGGYLLSGAVLLAQGEFVEAIRVLEKSLTLDKEQSITKSFLGQAFGLTGNKTRALELIKELQHECENEYVNAFHIARIYSSIRDLEKTFEWLEKAYQERNGELVYLKSYSRFGRGNIWGQEFRSDNRFQDLLHRLGLPTNETNQTEQSLEAQTVTLAPTTADMQSAETPAAPATLRRTVGRERERNELRAAFNAAKGGRGSLLCVAGEPGIGKTTLVEDFLAEIGPQENCTIARGRCSERLAGTEAYLPLLESLETLMQTDRSLGQRMKELAPTWYAQVVPLSVDTEESARLVAEVKAASQERMKRELANFLQSVARPRPLVLFFDDLHWADISTIDLLSFLAGKLDVMPVLIVVTYRPSDMLLAKHPFARIKPDLQARGMCRELLLEFLKENEIAEYLQQMMSNRPQFVVPTEPDTVTQPAKLKFVEPSPSIAVLPFVNISNDPDNEYFCDGLAEELLNALSKIEGLRVAARTSAFSFKGKETDVREIGQRLNVTTVLEGGVRKFGNRLRITAQLVNMADGYHLWSERYDREIKDIFDVQDEITLTVVGALKMKLLREQKAAVLKHYTDNTEAYQLYLKGRYHANRFTREGFHKAVEYLSEAIKKDPDYALAYAGIADAYYHAATIHMPPSEAFLKLKVASAKALELDDSLADARTLFAILVDHYERKPLEAESGFKRGIELAPNSAFTHQQYGLYLAKLGRFAEAIAELRRSLEFDPLSLISSFLLGWTYYFARQPEKTIEEALKAMEIDYGFWMGHWTMALGYEQSGQYAEALAELEKAKALDDSSWIPAVLARIYVRLGREEEAQKILDELTEKSKQQWVAPYLMATAYVSLGKRDQAFEWLQKALADYDEWIGCISVDPAVDPLRSDPRFHDLLRRIGRPQ